jgi:hypothetical protein
MQIVSVDGLPFQFPDAWQVTKLDAWPFYRDHFSRMWNGIKAADLGAIDGDTLWLIEAKDYRVHPQPRSTDLLARVAKKVADSLSCLMAAQHNAQTVIINALPRRPAVALSCMSSFISSRPRFNVAP